MTAYEVYTYLNTIAPFSAQESWDNSGFLVGTPAQKVRSIGVSLDITRDIIAMARQANVDLLVSHHPVIFKAPKALLNGQAAYELAAAGISAICAHTNWDVARGGVSDALGEALGYTGLREPEEPELKALRFAAHREPVDSRVLAERAGKALQSTQIRYNQGVPITTTAFCGGAGADFWRDAQARGAQALVTGDCSYHDFLDAGEAGFTIVAAGHYQTEWPGVERLAHQLEAAYPKLQVTLLCQPCPVLGL